MDSSTPQANSSCYLSCETAYQACLLSEEHGAMCYVERAQCTCSCSGPL